MIARTVNGNTTRVRGSFFMPSALSRRGIDFKPKVWCSREESNLHGFPHTVLSRTRLPFRHVSVVKSGP